jgi:alginate O-acetyltransferase complex protein AlgI
MLFTTGRFLGFFVVVFVVYWALRSQRLRLLWLAAAGAYFYMAWNPWLIGLLAASAASAFSAGLALERWETPGRRKAVLWGVLAANLGLLGFFKYANFFLDTAYVVGGWFGGAADRTLLDIVLPVGISFYTFETISYVVDVYTRRIRAERSLLHFAVFFLFFPRLVSGPIVRPRDFLPQTRRFHRFHWDRFQIGLQYFLLGFVKKAALADSLAPCIDPVFADPTGYGSAAVWLAALGYAAQIYLDFSGYSDMAVGLANMLGFHLAMNFNLPYLAANVSEFWRRWHISLSSWLRDYLFIPLGGSAGPTRETCRNLMIVMLLGGLWHGASWTFVAWGGYMGLLLVVHRLVRGRLPKWAALQPVYVAATFLSVAVGFVLFRSPSLHVFSAIGERMLRPFSGLSLPAADVRAVVGVLAVTLAANLLAYHVDLRRVERRAPAWLMGGAMAAAFLAALLFVPEDGRSFIYFQF